MKDLIVKNVDLFGDTIIAAQDKDGNIWAGISYFCKALGMTDTQRNTQTEKVRKDKTLSKATRKFPGGILGTVNESYALKLDFIPLWLAKITVTKKMEQSHPELADKLLEYQLKAKDILAAAFLPQTNMPQTTDGKIALLAQGHVELKAEIDSVKADLEKFKEDMPILGVEEGKITKAVKKRGIEILGGKEGNAYRDRSLRGKLYSDMHRELRRQFDVTTYKAIKRSQCDTALDMIKAYVPPMALGKQIEVSNAQMSMEV